MFKNILCMSVLAAIVAPAFAAEWMTDFEAAKAKAAQENKAVLIDFTGSDWCGFCIKLRKDVLDKPAFEEYAKDKFVLMEVDLPRAKKLTPEQMKRNQDLASQYEVSGFPTLLVVTPEGKVTGGFVGGRDSFEAVKNPLDAGLKAMELLKKAESAEGDEKARLLYEAYSSMPEELQSSCASGLAEEIVAADVNKVTGIHEMMADKLEMQEIEQKVQAAAATNDPAAILAVVKECYATARPANKKDLEMMIESLQGAIEMQEIADKMENDPGHAVEFMDEKLKTATGRQRLTILSLKAELQVRNANTVEDILAAKATMEEVVKEVPQAKAQVERIFANPADLLERVKQDRAEAEAAEADEK